MLLKNQSTKNRIIIIVSLLALVAAVIIGLMTMVNKDDQPTTDSSTEPTTEPDTTQRVIGGIWYGDHSQSPTDCQDIADTKKLVNKPDSGPTSVIEMIKGSDFYNYLADDQNLEGDKLDQHIIDNYHICKIEVTARNVEIEDVPDFPTGDPYQVYYGDSCFDRGYTNKETATDHELRFKLVSGSQQYWLAPTDECRAQAVGWLGYEDNTTFDLEFLIPKSATGQAQLIIEDFSRGFIDISDPDKPEPEKTKIGEISLPIEITTQ